jgi:hypothetical protein
MDGVDDAPPPRELLRIERDGTCLVVRYVCDAEQYQLLLEERQTALQPASFERGGLTRQEAEVLLWVTHGRTKSIQDFSFISDQCQ